MRPKTPTYSNPQSLAALARTKTLVPTGHPDLLVEVDRDTWLTPRYILECLGPFDLDPCAAPNNPTWVARRYFTKAEDGLQQEWTGRVFVNPPFSDTRPWVEKFARHRDGILLIPAVLESTHWRKHIWPNATLIWISNGRPRFCNPDGSTTTGRPLRPVALIAMNAREATVLRGVPLSGILLECWMVK